MKSNEMYFDILLSPHSNLSYFLSFCPFITCKEISQVYASVQFCVNLSIICHLMFSLTLGECHVLGRVMLSWAKDAKDG